MQAALDAILRRFITIGRLTVRWPDGRLECYAGGPGPEAGITIRSRAAARRLVLNPALAVGECYMDGTLTPDARGIYDVLDVLVSNLSANANNLPIARVWSALRLLKRRIDQYNPAPRARRNVAHH